jgi:hypothetical protein
MHVSSVTISQFIKLIILIMSISVSLKRVTAVAMAIAFVLSAFAVTSASAATCNFTLSHKLGQTGGEIKSIQQFLNANGFPVSTSGVGSAGMETMSFGGKTKAAVMAFQAAKGVTPVSGFWGPLTRATANASCGTGPVVVVPGTTPAAGNAVVAAAAQPGNSLAPLNANRVPFTKFTVTAGATPVTLNSVVVERGGLATDSSFAGIILLDDMGNQVGFDKTLNSNHQATIGAPTVIPAGSTKAFTVAANMASVVGSGQVAVFSVVAVNATGTVSGSLPITGAQHTINSTLTIGDMTLAQGSQNPGAANKKVGDVGYIFSGVKVTAGSTEDIRVQSIRFYQNGTASASDLGNVKINVDGTDFAAVVSADGKYYSASIAPGIVITKGNSKEAFVKADILSGSGRTVQFSVYDETDIFATGELYGYGVKLTQGSGWLFTASPAFTAAPIATVGAGTLTISKDNAVGNNNMAKNVDGQRLGALKIKAEGEAVNVRQLAFTVTGTHAQPVQLVKLVDADGKTIAGPVDAVGTVVTFSDSVTFPVGEKTYYLVGKAANAELNGVTFISALTTVSTPRGETSNQTAVVSGAATTLQTMTLKSGALVISMDPNPAAQQVVSGASQYLFGRVKLDAGNSGEDVRINNLQMTYVGTAGHVTACQAFDGATSLTSSVDAAAPFTLNFNSGVIVPKGASKLVDVKCNLSSSAVGGYSVGLTAVTNYTATGVASTSTVDSAAGLTLGTTTVGGLMTAVAGGNATISLDTTVPNNTVMALAYDNQTVDLGVVKLTGTVEALNVRELILSYTGTLASDLQNVAVTSMDGATTYASGTFSVGALTLTTNSLTIPKDGSIQVKVKGTLAEAGVGKPAVNGNTYDSVPVVTLTGVNTSGATLAPSSEMTLATLNINASTASGDTGAEGDLVFDAGEQIIFTSSYAGVGFAPTGYKLKTDDGSVDVACTGTTTVTCAFGAVAPASLRVGAGTSRTVKLVANTTTATAASNIQVKLDPVAANFIFSIAGNATSATTPSGPFSVGDVSFRGTLLGTAFSKAN